MTFGSELLSLWAAAPAERSFPGPRNALVLHWCNILGYKLEQEPPPPQVSVLLQPRFAYWRSTGGLVGALLWHKASEAREVGAEGCVGGGPADSPLQCHKPLQCSIVEIYLSGR